MASEQHLYILGKGVDAWNRWRRDYRGIVPDLRGADLGQVDLSGADLCRAMLRGAYLRDADLSDTDLYLADFRDAYLREANFKGAYLSRTNFCRAFLAKANFAKCYMEETLLGEVDLSQTKGLKSVQHLGPSTLGADSLALSMGKIPDEFLQGLGLSDALIAAVRAIPPEQLARPACFISFCSKDHKFAKRLHSDLQAGGVRAWLIPQELRGSGKVRPTIGQALRDRDRYVPVLSKQALNQDWLAEEIELSLEEEKVRKARLIFPIRLDDALSKSDQEWAAGLAESHPPADFSAWKTPESYQKNLSDFVAALSK